jgi:hypothetical protein
MEAIDTTTGYVMQQGSKERQTVSLCRGRLSIKSLPLISVPVLPEVHHDSGVLARALPPGLKGVCLGQTPLGCSAARVEALGPIRSAARVL